jgi:hypothetical protein
MRWLIQTVTSLKECAGGIEITPPEAANPCSSFAISDAGAILSLALIQTTKVIR